MMNSLCMAIMIIGGIYDLTLLSSNVVSAYNYFNVLQPIEIYR